MNSPFSLQPKSHNEYADFLRYVIGVNVIPADTRHKKTQIQWKVFQNAPISEWQHEQWSKGGAFNQGIAIILGKVWHREDKKDLYFILIDADKRHAIEEFCTRNRKVIPLQEIAQKFMVEQHADNLDKAHIYFYSPIPFPKKPADSILGLEVKGLGEHGIAFCSPSMHKDGWPYETIGTNQPVVLNITQARELIQHINQICIKYGVQYLEKASRIDGKIKTMIKTLQIDPSIRIPEHTRHNTLIATADSLLFNHLDKKKEKEKDLRNFFTQINERLCDPEPLPESEINNIWNSALNFVQRIKENHDQQVLKEDVSQQQPEEINLIKEVSEEIQNTYKFVTIEETKEILYYRGGTYIKGGEVLIEKSAERLFGYQLSNKILAEIKGHIMRSTYRSRTEFDTDINIINVKNGLYNISTTEFKKHTSDYLSLDQIPIVYNPKAKPQLFGKYLKEVLYPVEIRTAVEAMAYTFYRDNPFEIITTLFGYGANGKGVFTSILTSLHGIRNTSNVPLHAMLKDVFVLSDLENKNINIDSELSGATIYDTAILKKLTGRQPVRIQRKNQRAYDAILYAKLFFSANKIPVSTDDTDAYYRRNVIISFPNRFEGNQEDPNLTAKLTTEEELSSIFNVLMIALRRLLNMRRIFVNEKTIAERRSRYELAAKPIECFMHDAIAEDSTEYDRTLKET
ncbi:MAG TPA: phage/plasmid primase, P4 family, partial [Nitrososphaeraceae archaeon]|nr:phage/plasmid primase, P4 family [Nitrososphaeraceae archaeon]